MAFDLRNDVFKIDFDGGDGRERSLYFISGHHQYPSLPSYKSFLPNQIMEEISGKVALIDNLPYGLATARSLNIKVNLANFTGDYGDVAKQIVRTHSEFQKTVNGRAMYVPNVWLLTDSGGPDFAFCQVPSTQKIPISKDKAEYSIELIGIEKAVFEQLRIEDLDLDNFTGTYETTGDNSPSDILYDLVYSLDGGSNYRKIGEEPNNDQRIYSMGDFFGRIKDKAENITDAYLRGFVFTETVTFNLSDIDNIWKFYEQDPTTNHEKSTNVVLFEDLLLCGALLGSSGYNGGFFNPAGNGLYAYNNVWSFLRQFCEFYMLKSVWGSSTTNAFELSFYKPFEAITTDSDVNDLDPKEFDLEPSANYISETTSFIVGAGAYDYQDYKAISEFGSLDGKSEDVEIMFNNYLLKFVDGINAGGNDSDKDKFVITIAELRKKGFMSDRTLYYYKNAIGIRFLKVHEDCQLDIGGGVPSIVGNIAYLSLPYPDYTVEGSRFLTNMTWYSELVPVIQQRMPYYGIAYNRVLATKEILGNTSQGILTATLGYQINNSLGLDLSKIGEVYNIDLGLVSNIPSLGEFSGSLILTEIDYNYLNGDVKCKFFMRGDSNA